MKSKHVPGASLATISLLAVTTCAVAAPLGLYRVASVSVTDIGTLGGTHAYAADINNSGNIVGNSTTSLGNRHAYLYKAGVMYDISPPGTTLSEGRAISVYDEVAGHFSNDGGRWHVYRWKAGVSYPLNDSDPSGAVGYSRANGISIHGLIAGVRYSLTTPTPTSPQHSATVWTSDTTFLTLSRALTGYENYASDVNIRREVVGADTFDSNNGRRWILLASGGITNDAAPLPVLPATAIYSHVIIEGLNAKRNVVGHVQCCPGLGSIRRHAWFWDGSSASSTHLGLLPGGTYSQADDINDERFIAGYGERTAPLAPAFESGFIYHADFGLYELPGLSAKFKTCRASALNERKSTGLIQVVGGCGDGSGPLHAVRWDVTVERTSADGPTP